MRILLILLLLPLPVLAATPKGIVMGEECRQANVKKLGFVCHLRPQGLWIENVEDMLKMSAERRRQSRYEFHRLIMRYYDFGGRHFSMTSFKWQHGKRRECSIQSNRGYICFDYLCKADGTCEPVEK